MKRLSVAALAVAVVLAAFAAAVASGGPGISADEALVKLKQGNTRFVSGALEHPNQNAARRQDTGTNGQHPFAVVLTCADSRVPPEVLFDQGLGDLFAVRVAGNVAATDEIGSIEYAVEHLGSPLVVVLGHTSCGAIKGACDDVKMGNLTTLLEKFKPAVAAASTPGEHNSHNHAFVDDVTELNVKQVVQKIRDQSPILKAMEDEGKIRIVGALYNTSNGKVSWY